MRIAGLGIGIVATAWAAAALAQPVTGGELAGNVVGPFGEPLAGVVLNAESISGYRVDTETGDDGVFRFTTVP